MPTAQVKTRLTANRFLDSHPFLCRMRGSDTNANTNSDPDSHSDTAPSADAAAAASLSRGFTAVRPAVCYGLLLLNARPLLQKSDGFLASRLVRLCSHAI